MSADFGWTQIDELVLRNEFIFGIAIGAEFILTFEQVNFMCNSN